MVRPEGVEPPTYWFVASCSIQLSYGRTLQGCNSLSIPEMAFQGNHPVWEIRQLACRNFGGWRRSRRLEHRHGLDYVQSGAAKELVDDRLGQPGGVVFDANRLFSFVELELANAVDLTQACDGGDCRLGGRNSVAVKNVQLRHRLMLSAGSTSIAKVFSGNP